MYYDYKRYNGIQYLDFVLPSDVLLNGINYLNTFTPFEVLNRFKVDYLFRGKWSSAVISYPLFSKC